MLEQTILVILTTSCFHGYIQCRYLGSNTEACKLLDSTAELKQQAWAWKNP